MWKGYLCAALAAAFYGTNPIFAVPLYGLGMNAASVLLFRYLLGLPLLAVLVLAKCERLMLHSNEAIPVAALGILMGISSLALYESYRFMNAGLASTLLFMYPLFTSLIMTVFFREKFRAATAVSLAAMGVGLYLLLKPGEGGSFNWIGFGLVCASTLAYAIYLVLVKVARNLGSLSPAQSLGWQLLFGSIVFIIPCSQNLTLPHSAFEWLNLGALAIFPTVLSLLFTIRAILIAGPTATALFGALEPVTAVAASCILLGESVTAREIAGGILIIAATMPVMLRKGGKAG